VRSIHGVNQVMPVGAVPQIVVSALGPHRGGLMRDLTKEIGGLGASVAATRKVALGNRFAMLMSVWVPPGAVLPEDVVSQLQTSFSDVAGVILQAEILSEEETDPAGPRDAGESQQRHLRIECEQRPGIVLAITQLLTDADCKVSDLRADTYSKAGVIWFDMSCTVSMPDTMAASEVGDQLNFWRTSSGAKVDFEYRV